MGRLENKIALVTGSGNGIGRATAELFAAEGAVVYVTDVDAAAAEAVAGGITAKGQTAHWAAMDVSKGQDVSSVMRRVKAEQGRLDVLVNNAGLNVRGDFRHMSDADWVKLREVNLDGVVRVARDGFDLLRASPSASLINVASIMGSRGLRQLTGYSATKGAVVALTKGLAFEYAPFKIRVNTLSPGYVETALTERILRNPIFEKWLIDRTLLKRLGKVEDIAKAALFLASDDSVYMTGAELVVDGGMTASL
ncbi:MAG: SDR family oxidoreductase [Hyphomicrobium sp.]|jgi:NAD(P)-dependent dehydrogenase (short-subunit alcohol dehydrogenase family)|nr:SDR family oxidoreductase [Hyphomicrobium sp.]